MKYKVGDKVKIKTWEELEKEFGLDRYNNSIESICIKCDCSFMDYMEIELNAKFPNRIIEIEKITFGRYKMKRLCCNWTDDMIKCLAKDYKKPEPITSRFDILDIREE